MDGNGRTESEEVVVNRWYTQVRCDQCQFGLTSLDDEGNVGPEATEFMTTISGGNEQILFWWARTFSVRTAERRLAKSILHDWWLRYCGVRKSMRAAGHGEAQGLTGRDRQLTIAAVEAGPTLEEPYLSSWQHSRSPRIQRYWTAAEP